MTIATANSHGVYADRDRLFLKRKRSGRRGVNQAEIRVAETSEGWRAASSFSFFSGNHWGSSSPITDHCAVHPTREAAIAAEVGLLRSRLTDARSIEPSMQPERDQILAWLDALTPQQLDLFGIAA